MSFSREYRGGERVLWQIDIVSFVWFRVSCERARNLRVEEGGMKVRDDLRVVLCRQMYLNSGVGCSGRERALGFRAWREGGEGSD